MNNYSYRADNFPPVLKNLIIINVLVYIAQLTVQGLTEKIVMYPVMSPHFEPYQVVTHMFSHDTDSIFHLGFNMLALWMFGRILEKVWGGKRFLLFYLLCGVGSAACQMLEQFIRFEQMQQALAAGNQASAVYYMKALGPTLGASGAIMGIVVAFAYLFPNTELMFIFIPIPIKAKWLVLIAIGIDLFFGLLSLSSDDVARFGHIGGAITGFIIVFFWNRTNRKRFY